jgi:hypothetical protein
VRGGRISREDYSTFHITGSKKQSEERAALFAVRVNVIAMCIAYRFVTVGPKPVLMGFRFCYGLSFLTVFVFWHG